MIKILEAITNYNITITQYKIIFLCLLEKYNQKEICENFNFTASSVNVACRTLERLNILKMEINSNKRIYTINLKNFVAFKTTKDIKNFKNNMLNFIKIKGVNKTDIRVILICLNENQNYSQKEICERYNLVKTSTNKSIDKLTDLHLLIKIKEYDYFTYKSNFQI